MRFHVLEQLKQPLGARLHWQISEHRLLLDDDVDLGELTGFVDFLKTDKGLLLNVDIAAISHGRCSRCLLEVDYPLHLQFQEEYLPTTSAETGLPLPLPEDADNFLIGPDFTLDLGEALRQYKLMIEPLKVLCKPDCLGLCPGCGQNLNSGACRCSAQPDPRWQALSSVARQLKSKERS
ncbi:MAG TPA: DUF177 domain-containing protein [Dehalococcoidia bacterium]|nr:DUF177 domain-containing protein [Dehalococcoidia bacterium]